MSTSIGELTPYLSRGLFADTPLDGISNFDTPLRQQQQLMKRGQHNIVINNFDDDDLTNGPLNLQSTHTKHDHSNDELCKKSEQEMRSIGKDGSMTTHKVVNMSERKVHGACRIIN